MNLLSPTGGIGGLMLSDRNAAPRENVQSEPEIASQPRTRNLTDKSNSHADREQKLVSSGLQTGLNSHRDTQYHNPFHSFED